jgi:hypothetical protein
MEQTNPRSRRSVRLGLVGVFIAAKLFFVGDASAQTQEEYAPVIDPANFTTEITNPYFPLKPGTRWVYEGPDDAGDIERGEVKVTTDTRKVMGVTTVVVHDVRTVKGELQEDTYDWYAQDKEGNVWYFGEDTKAYNAGKVESTEGSWEAGVDGAQPGIVMNANPKVGDSYRQEYYKGHAEDMADVLSLDEKRTVRYGSYEGVLKTKDYTPLEPGLVEHKYYAKDVGLIYEVHVEGPAGEIELIEMTTTAGGSPPSPSPSPSPPACEEGDPQ